MKTQEYRVYMLAGGGNAHTQVEVEAATEDEATEKALELQAQGKVDWTLTDMAGRSRELGPWAWQDDDVEITCVEEVGDL